MKTIVKYESFQNLYKINDVHLHNGTTMNQLYIHGSSNLF
jgi:hypothetical protein